MRKLDTYMHAILIITAYHTVIMIIFLSIEHQCFETKYGLLKEEHQIS